MPAQLPPERMTVAEKLELLKTIWDSLSRNPNDATMPDWQKEFLEERARQLSAGEAPIMPWEDAKARFLKMGL